MAAACPSCRNEMTSLDLEGRLLGRVEVELCFSCQGIWFDGYESLQIAPGGIIELFRLIHDHRDDARLPLAGELRCPRCDERMLKSLDRVKSGQFTYHRCPQHHGRFSVFGQFMIEKGFVRQLTNVEIERLKAQVGVVRCASCGAPVDIRLEAACAHCGSPIAILDPAAVEQALAHYQQAEMKRKTVDTAGLAEALLSQERERGRREREQRQSVFDAGDRLEMVDLVGAGVDLVWQFLSD